MNEEEKLEEYEEKLKIASEELEKRKKALNIPEIIPEPIEKEPEIPEENQIKTTDKKEKKDKKNWWEKLFNKKTLGKTNKVAILLLRNSGNAEALEIEPKKGFFTIDNKIYHQRRDCVWTITKDRLPLAIIRENNLTPIGTQAWEDKTLQEKFAELQDHVLRGIRHAELIRLGEKDIKQIDMKRAIGIGLLVVIVVAVVMSYI